MTKMPTSRDPLVTVQCFLLFSVKTRSELNLYLCSFSYQVRGNCVSIQLTHALTHSSFCVFTLSSLSPLALLPKSRSVPEIPNFAYLIFAAYFFATGGGYDKLEVYKCSDGVKAPAVTREMVIRFPSCMVSWRHKEFHMVIQMLHLNLLPISTPELSASTELVTRLLST